MAHKYDLDTHTYFDVKILPEAVDQVLASTRAESANGSLVGVEYLGHVGELTNHLLYRVPKPLSSLPALDQSHNHDEEQRNKQIVDAISAVSGVVQVDVQTLRQRAKRDEL